MMTETARFTETERREARALVRQLLRSRNNPLADALRAEIARDPGRVAWLGDPVANVADPKGRMRDGKRLGGRR
jgi:hypothetical protein